MNVEPVPYVYEYSPTRPIILPYLDHTEVSGTIPTPKASGEIPDTILFRDGQNTVTNNPSLRTGFPNFVETIKVSDIPVLNASSTDSEKFKFSLYVNVFNMFKNGYNPDFADAIGVPSTFSFLSIREE